MVRATWRVEPPRTRRRRPHRGLPLVALFTMGCFAANMADYSVERTYRVDDRESSEVTGAPPPGFSKVAFIPPAWCREQAPAKPADLTAQETKTRCRDVMAEFELAAIKSAFEVVHWRTYRPPATEGETAGSPPVDLVFTLEAQREAASLGPRLTALGEQVRLQEVTGQRRTDWLDLDDEAAIHRRCEPLFRAFSAAPINTVNWTLVAVNPVSGQTVARFEQAAFEPEGPGGVLTAEYSTRVGSKATDANWGLTGFVVAGAFAGGIGIADLAVGEDSEATDDVLGIPNVAVVVALVTVGLALNFVERWPAPDEALCSHGSLAWRSDRDRWRTAESITVRHLARRSMSAFAALRHTQASP